MDGHAKQQLKVFVAVPMAGMTLAQMGAEVIRFDRLEGGLDARRMPYSPSGSSLFWSGMNKGKKSIAIDMKSPEGKELISIFLSQLFLLTICSSLNANSYGCPSY